MLTGSVTQAHILSWVEKCLENENLSNYEIKITGTTEKGDGYSSEILFANVKGTSKDNSDKVLDLVIKHGKSNDYLRKVSPMRDGYENEIYMYNIVFPIFRKFESERTISNGFQSVPKCYLTLLLKNMEVLILDNIKKQGFELHDRTQPLNSNHLKIILKEYGKLHALSFALKEHDKEHFNSIAKFKPVFEDFFSEKSFKEVSHQTYIKALDILLERGEENLYKSFKKIGAKSSVDRLLDLMTEKEPQSVIVHGDCWNNNFMFKYESGDKSSPSHVKILDWQISTLRSPAFDLAYLIYGSSSKEQLDTFEELLETYYGSFSTHLLALGSSPEKLFTYEDLKRHWKKYSLFGVLFVPTILRFVLCKKEDAPSLEDIKEGQGVGSLMAPDISNEDAYYDRLKAVFTHYLEYTLSL